MNGLSYFSGEFRNPAREAEFQAHRLPEILGQLRLVFLCSAVLNTLFLFSDWRFFGQPHFHIALSARLTVVAISLACAWLNSRARTFPAAQRIMVLWQWVTTPAVAMLVSSHSDIALLVVLMLPMIYFLVVPTQFRWSLVSAGGCSLLLLGAYVYPSPPEHTVTGLVLAVLTFNAALSIAVNRTNRLRRLEWSAVQAEQAARLELARNSDTLEAIFKTVPIPLVVTGQDGEIIKCNDGACAFFGGPEAVARIGNVLDVYVDPSHRESILTALRTDGCIDGFESQMRRADGSIRDVLISSRLTMIEGNLRVVSSAIDITERKLVELHLAELAMSDSLTGLANRSHFMTVAGRAMTAAREKGTRMAILLLDVDDFKQVNDTAGHDAGDAVLRAVAARLQASIRPGDLVARLGGDEFAVMLTGLGSDADLQTIIHRMMAKLTEPLVYASRSIACRASVGASLFPDHSEQIEDLMKCADIALYEAKARGRARACTFEASMLAAWEEHTHMLFTAREAIADNEVRPFYQPQVELSTGKIIGFEALLRRVLPNGEIALPATISAAFDHPDLAQAISARMIEQVLRDIRSWLDRGLDIGHVAINLSSADLRNESFPEHLLANLAAAGLTAEQIELEVTESVFLGRGAESVERALRLLSRSGIRIALDDFGTGYASLSHLKQFPIDVIKIDQRFVRDLQDDPDDAAIVRAVLNLSHSLGIKTVAEGIETQAQADYLRAGGCQIGQGFLYSPAISARDVPGLFEQRSSRKAARKVA